MRRHGNYALNDFDDDYSGQGGSDAGQSMISGTLLRDRLSNSRATFDGIGLLSTT